MFDHASIVRQLARFLGPRSCRVMDTAFACDRLRFGYPVSDTVYYSHRDFRPLTVQISPIQNPTELDAPAAVPEPRAVHTPRSAF